MKRRCLQVGLAFLAIQGLSAVTVHADTLIYSQFGALNQPSPGRSLYQVNLEPNPGGGSTTVNPGDGILTDNVAGGYSTVTANPKWDGAFVNTIANMHCWGNTPDGVPIKLTTYRYIYAISLPALPTPAANSICSTVDHLMIQFWDGGGGLWSNPNRVSLETTIYWDLDPVNSTYGDIFVYTNNTPGDYRSGLKLLNTGIHVTPDVNHWHVFEVRADLANQVYAGIVIDGQWDPLSGVKMAQIQHLNWGNDTSLIFTCEAENSWRFANTQWSANFKDVKIYRQ